MHLLRKCEINWISCPLRPVSYTHLDVYKRQGTSSFYPPHHMTMGEGGAVYTDNPLLNKIIRSFRDWGRDCVCPSGHDNVCGHRFDRQYGELPLGYDHKYVYSHFGYNLKATDMQAAIGCAQLDKFPSFVEKRRHNFERLWKNLEDPADQLILPVAVSYTHLWPMPRRDRPGALFLRENIRAGGGRRL